jgi:hypothetical protein
MAARNIQGSAGDQIAGVHGIRTFPSAALPADGISLAALLREAYDQGGKAVTSATAVMVNGTTIFTVAGGPIKIEELVSYCVTANDTTASTLQWSADPTGGAAATTFSAASASLASAAAGTTVVLNMTALNTAPDIVVTGVSLGGVVTRGIIIPAGIITTVIGVGSTTGTWRHHLRYRPLARGVTVT